MKKIKSLCVIFGMSTMLNTAYAVGEGLYLGGQVGQSNTNNQAITTLPAITAEEPDNTGIAARVIVGYNFSQYVAAEGGYTRYAPSKYSSAGGGSPQIRDDSGDVLVKGIYQLSRFSVFGKAGFAVIRQKTPGSLRAETTKKTDIFLRPAAGVGVGFDITQLWVADLSYTRIISRGTALQPIDFVALGISYHFANEYCGQFLC